MTRKNIFSADSFAIIARCQLLITAHTVIIATCLFSLYYDYSVYYIGRDRTYSKMLIRIMKAFNLKAQHILKHFLFKIYSILTGMKSNI